MWELSPPFCQFGAAGADSFSLCFGEFRNTHARAHTVGEILVDWMSRFARHSVNLKLRLAGRFVHYVRISSTHTGKSSTLSHITEDIYSKTRLYRAYMVWLGANSYSQASGPVLTSWKSTGSPLAWSLAFSRFSSTCSTLLRVSLWELLLGGMVVHISPYVKGRQP